MSSEMYYTPKEHIPVFRIIYKDDCEPCVEFKNERTGKTEPPIPVTAFVAQLLNQTVYSKLGLGNSKT